MEIPGNYFGLWKEPMKYFDEIHLCYHYIIQTHPQRLCSRFIRAFTLCAERRPFPRFLYSVRVLSVNVFKVTGLLLRELSQRAVNTFSTTFACFYLCLEKSSRTLGILRLFYCIIIDNKCLALKTECLQRSLFVNVSAERNEK